MDGCISILWPFEEALKDILREFRIWTEPLWCHVTAYPEFLKYVHHCTSVSRVGAIARSPLFVPRSTMLRIPIFSAPM